MNYELHWMKRHATVTSIAVITGGTDLAGITEATTLGNDLLVTDTYYNRVQNEIGKRHRERFDRIRDNLTISLIECSHYASEAVVMRADVVKLCRDHFGLDCEFMPQEDPWD